MAYYVKINPKVAQALGVTVPPRRDGSYIVWQGQLSPLGDISDLDALCARLGAVKLTPMGYRMETEGLQCAKLPTPTDPEYIPDEPTEEETATEEQPTTEEEQPTEETPTEDEPTDEAGEGGEQ